MLHPFGYSISFKLSLIETLLVLASSLRLLATLHAGALIMLSLANLGNNASLGAATLETLQSAIDGLAVLNMDLRHLYFPPSEVSGYIQDTLRAIKHGFNKGYYTDAHPHCQGLFFRISLKKPISTDTAAPEQETAVHFFTY